MVSLNDFWFDVFVSVIAGLFLAVMVDFYQKRRDTPVKKHIQRFGPVFLVCFLLIMLAITISTDKTKETTSTPTPTQIATSTPTPPPEIKITPPLNYKVNLLEGIHGTAKNIQEGDEIWVFVYSYSDNKYYLIGENVTLHNNSWSINRQIGEDNENGGEFDIVAVLADKVAQDKYNYYFEEKGVTAMPNVTDVVEVYDQITVTRM